MKHGIKTTLFRKSFVVFSLILIFVSFLVSVESKEKRSVTLMAYNVENLFDATNDGPLQKDPAFLPMSEKLKWNKNLCKSKRGFYRTLCENLDWTQEKYEKKLAKIAQVILDYDNAKGPDIVVLEELENKQVMTDLWEKHLYAQGYLEPIHFESNGHRGMDVAMISKFPVDLAISHTIDLSDLEMLTRDILEARFIIDGQYELRVAANHWPSLRNPQESRFKAAEVIREIAQEAKRDGVPFIAMGDFNTLDNESPNPIADNIADSNPENKKIPLVDVHKFLETVLQFPGGTHYYKGRWNHLDRILASKDLFEDGNPLQINPFSFKIVSNKYLFKKNQKSEKVPFRYNFFKDTGFSDHLPLTVKIAID